MEPPELALNWGQRSTVRGGIPCLGSVDFVTTERERMVAGEPLLGARRRAGRFAPPCPQAHRPLQRDRPRRCGRAAGDFSPTCSPPAETTALSSRRSSATTAGTYSFGPVCVHELQLRRPRRGARAGRRKQTLFGPAVQLCAVTHPLDPRERERGLEWGSRSRSAATCGSAPARSSARASRSRRRLGDRRRQRRRARHPGRGAGGRQPLPRDPRARVAASARVERAARSRRSTTHVSAPGSCRDPCASRRCRHGGRLPWRSPVAGAAARTGWREPPRGRRRACTRWSSRRSPRGRRSTGCTRGQCSSCAIATATRWRARRSTSTATATRPRPPARLASSRASRRACAARSSRRRSAT